MNELDLEEIVQLLRTAYIEENWDTIQDVIDMISKYTNELDINEKKILDEWN